MEINMDRDTMALIMTICYLMGREFSPGMVQQKYQTSLLTIQEYEKRPGGQPPYPEKGRS